jgi:hypothetical protein
VSERAKRSVRVRIINNLTKKEKKKTKQKNYKTNKKKGRKLNNNKIPIYI